MRVHYLFMWLNNRISKNQLKITWNKEQWLASFSLWVCVLHGSEWWMSDEGLTSSTSLYAYFYISLISVQSLNWGQVAFLIIHYGCWFPKTKVINEINTQILNPHPPPLVPQCHFLTSFKFMVLLGSQWQILQNQVCQSMQGTLGEEYTHDNHLIFPHLHWVW